MWTKAKKRAFRTFAEAIKNDNPIIETKEEAVYSLANWYSKKLYFVHSKKVKRSLIDSFIGFEYYCCMKKYDGVWSFPVDGLFIARAMAEYMNLLSLSCINPIKIRNVQKAVRIYVNTIDIDNNFNWDKKIDNNLHKEIGKAAVRNREALEKVCVTTLLDKMMKSDSFRAHWMLYGIVNKYNISRWLVIRKSDFNFKNGTVRYHRNSKEDLKIPYWMCPELIEDPNINQICNVEYPDKILSYTGIFELLTKRYFTKRDVFAFGRGVTINYLVNMIFEILSLNEFSAARERILKNNAYKPYLAFDEERPEKSDYINLFRHERRKRNIKIAK